MNPGGVDRGYASVKRSPVQLLAELADETRYAVLERLEQGRPQPAASSRPPCAKKAGWQQAPAGPFVAELRVTR